LTSHPGQPYGIPFGSNSEATPIDKQHDKRSMVQIRKVRHKLSHRSISDLQQKEEADTAQPHAKRWTFAWDTRIVRSVPGSQGAIHSEPVEAAKTTRRSLDHLKESQGGSAAALRHEPAQMAKTMRRSLDHFKAPQASAHHREAARAAKTMRRSPQMSDKPLADIAWAFPMPFTKRALEKEAAIEDSSRQELTKRNLSDFLEEMLRAGAGQDLFKRKWTDLLEDMMRNGGGQELFKRNSADVPEDPELFGQRWADLLEDMLQDGPDEELFKRNWFDTLQDMMRGRTRQELSKRSWDDRINGLAHDDGSNERRGLEHFAFTDAPDRPELGKRDWDSFLEEVMQTLTPWVCDVGC
jgi:hypothetical protein